MLFMRLYQVFVLLFSWMISWNSVASSQNLRKRQGSNVCPNNLWRQYKGMCFLRLTIQYRLGYLSHICRSKFVPSSLAKIRSIDDLNFINNAFGENTYWIGLGGATGRKWVGESVWQDGTKASFLNFAAGQPAYINDNCVSVSSDLKFYVGSCAIKRQAVCTTPAAVDLCESNRFRCHKNAECFRTYFSFVCVCNDGFAGDGITSCSRSKGCPPGEWMEHKGLCYVRTYDYISYEEAQAECRKKYNGSTLAKFRYEGDQYFIAFKYNYGAYYWIGLRRSKDSFRDELTWDDGSKVLYRKFNPGQPNNDQIHEHCVFTATEGHWHDGLCDSNQRALCSVNAKESQRKKQLTTKAASPAVAKIAVAKPIVEKAPVKNALVGNPSVDKATATYTVINGGLIGIAVGVLIVGAYIGYNKFAIQRSNARSDRSKSKEVAAGVLLE